MTTHPVSLPQSPAPLTYNTVSSLTEPVRASSATRLPGSAAFSLLGGLDSQANGTSGIGEITSTSTKVVGYLPVSLFAAAAVTIGSDEYIFGGATGSSASPTPEQGILQYDVLSSNATVTEIAHLPSANYGLGAAVIGSTAYIVGGDNGTTTLDTIVSWHPGGQAAVAGTLPVALRYAAVAAVSGRIVIAGGLLANNAASRQVFIFDPTTHKVSTLRVQLPKGIYAASGASLGKLAYVIGGAYPTGAATNPTATAVDTIYSVDPISGKLATAGSLTAGTRAEAVAVKVGDEIYLAGGLTGTSTTAAVGTLTATTKAG
ncbi:MAG: hypothetical protein ABSC56_10850 [Solirubrobacteraceae bacterium]